MILQMAWRNIWRNKTRSLVIIFSVAIGLFAGLASLALQKGMMISRVRTVIDTEAGHLQIHHPEFKKDLEPAYTLDWDEQQVSAIRSSGRVKALTKRSVVQAMLATPSGSAGVLVNGVVPGQENEVSGLNKKIKEGNEFSTTRKNEILVGRKLADKMKLKTGSKLVLTFTDTASNLVSAAFRVEGIYQTENTPLDEKNVYVKISDLNELLGIGNSFHELTILLHNDKDLERTYLELKHEYPGLLIESWKEISPETELMTSTLDSYMYIIVGIIMLALAFGIINTMLMAILERTREIGMMVALGMNRTRLFLLVFLETAILTILGTPFGILLGWVVTGYFSRRGIDISKVAGEAMSSFGFSSMIYPEFPLENLPVILLIVILTAIFSCIFPAIKSGRLQPADALRN